MRKFLWDSNKASRMYTIQTFKEQDLWATLILFYFRTIKLYKLSIFKRTISSTRLYNFKTEADAIAASLEYIANQDAETLQMEIDLSR